MATNEFGDSASPIMDQVYATSPAPTPAATKENKRKRGRIACLTCRSSKIRCKNDESGSKCKRCDERNADCNYEDANTWRPERRLKVSCSVQSNNIKSNERLIRKLPAITGKFSKSYRFYRRESSRCLQAHLASAGRIMALAVGVELIIQSSADTRSTTTRNSLS
jgi:hypothetical protein